VPTVSTRLGFASSMIWRNRSFTGSVAVPSPVPMPSWFKCSSDFMQSTVLSPILVGNQLASRWAARAGAPSRICGRYLSSKWWA
jgi:hypothetical protein